MASISDDVRLYALTAIIEPARQRGDALVEVNARDIERALGLRGRNLMPTVCAALKAKTKFLEPNRLQIERVSGPPSGQSSTVKITYRMGAGAAAPAPDWFESLHGLLSGMFDADGGAEDFLRKERAAYNGPSRQPYAGVAPLELRATSAREVSEIPKGGLPPANEAARPRPAGTFRGSSASGARTPVERKR